MNERIAKCFNKGAETYDSAALVQMQVAERLIQRLPNFSEKILEVGCGTGLLSEKLLFCYPKASLLLIDIAPLMLARCQKRLSDFTQVDYRCLDGQTLKNLGSFNLIVSSMTFHWFKEFQSSFNNMLNQLSPGGKLVFAMLGENSLIEWRNLCEKFHFPLTTRHFPALQSLKAQFPLFKWDIETISQSYAHGYEFLRSLKNIGATAACPHSESFTPAQLRRLMRELNNEISIRYEIIFGEYDV